MSMLILHNEEISGSEWQEFLTQNNHSNPFQTPEWFNLFNSVNGLAAQAIAISENTKILALAVITIQKERGIKGFFSRRGIIYGGPLISAGRTDALELLLQTLSGEIGKRTIYLETRNLTDYHEYSGTFLKKGWAYVPYLDFHVDTRDRQIMTASVSDSRMRQIRKAIRGGVSWKEAVNVDEVKIFYNILTDLYKTRVKKPLLTWDFFRTCFDRGFGKFLLVHYSGKIIGGIFCPFITGKAVYELYVCGLDNKYKEQYPSVIATWAAMEYAIQNGIPLFSFMGAGKPNEDYGVRDFKSRFGGIHVEYGRYLKVNNAALYIVGKHGLKINKLFKG